MEKGGCKPASVSTLAMSARKFNMKIQSLCVPVWEEFKIMKVPLGEDPIFTLIKNKLSNLKYVCVEK